MNYNVYIYNIYYYSIYIIPKPHQYIAYIWLCHVLNVEKRWINLQWIAGLSWGARSQSGFRSLSPRGRAERHWGFGRTNIRAESVFSIVLQTLWYTDSMNVKKNVVMPCNGILEVFFCCKGRFISIPFEGCKTLDFWSFHCALRWRRVSGLVFLFMFNWMYSEWQEMIQIWVQSRWPNEVKLSTRRLRSSRHDSMPTPQQDLRPAKWRIDGRVRDPTDVAWQKVFGTHGF